MHKPMPSKCSASLYIQSSESKCMRCVGDEGTERNLDNSINGQNAVNSTI